MRHLNVKLVLRAPKHKVFYPEKDSEQKTYFGLRKYLEDDKPLHIIMLHGMGLGKPEFTDAALTASQAAKNINHILTALGSTLGTAKPPDESTTFGAIKLYKYNVNLRDGKKIIFHEINYAGYLAFDKSPYSTVSHIKDSKRTLYHNDKPLIKKGALVNRNLKTALVTWGLADAAIYLDAGKREVIVNNVVEALKSIHQKINSDGGRICFITQSLGSKVLFDSLAELYHLTKKQYAVRPSVDILANTQTIYMMANQLPLLELGTEFDRVYQWERLFQSKTIGKTKFPTPKQLTIVAYSDPSDFLTYPIEPTVQQFVGPTTNLNAIDVMVTNSKPIFGLFSNPLKAHTGHFENKILMKHLVDGHTQL